MLMRSSIHRNIFFGAIFGALVFIALFVAGVFSARAVSATCYDITGQGTATPVNGVPNSGVIHFDAPLAPNVAYEACVEDEGAIPGNGPFTVKGWAWDDNLGWISMYCANENGDGAPYENLGVSCGNFLYGAFMDGPAGSNPGRLSGYAWGDNSGWVSFNCSDGGTCGIPPAGVNYWVEAETTEAACLGQVFSFGFPLGCTVNLDESVYAWSDNVGWMDFTGVKFPWVEFSAIAVDVELKIKASGGADLTAVNKLTAPVADGSDKYEMILHVTNQSDGLPINPADYTVTVTPVWVQDTVDTDQTDAANADHAFDNFGAATKPFAFSDFGAYGASVVDAYVANVISKAPTSSMNGYDNGGDGSVDFSYEEFVLGNPIAPAVVPLNDLVLSDVLVSVVHTATAFCAFGDPVCAQKSVAGPYAGANFHFVPAVEVSEMDDSINGATITATRTVANTINYQVDCRGIYGGDCPAGSVNVYSGVKDPLVFVFGSDDCTGVSPFNLDLLGTFFQVTPYMEFNVIGNLCPESGPDYGVDAYIYSKVTYTNGVPISYFSNKIPRVTGSLIGIPVASISGNVYSTGATNPVSGQEIRSLGDVSTNILRNTLLSNVRGIVSGADVQSGGGSITGWTVPTGFDVSGNIAKLLPDIASMPKVYYAIGNVTIDANALDLTWNGERTIIVDGGNLFIDRNLYNGAATLNKLGIIVLKDLATGAGGNIYVAPGVTNIQANMYADGSFFSYDGVHPENINVAGEPFFADEAARFNALKNQLFIEGSLASQNTIGGAVKNPPILGDGTVALAIEGVYGAAPTGKSQARLYDLNFLRYYGYVFERKDATTPCPGDAVDQQFPAECPGGPNYNIVAQPVANGGDLVLMSTDPSVQAAQGLTAADASAVYINFNPPSLTLPAFGSSGGVDIRIRP